MNPFHQLNLNFKPVAGKWPSPTQVLLLQASLLPGDAAVDAWDTISKYVDIDRLDAKSQYLLPLVYHNLNSLNVKHPLLEKLKGTYRLTWTKNNILFKHTSASIMALLDAGIQVLLLKGAALTTLYYRNLGLRPMVDLDILVHPDQARRAVSTLVEFDWLPAKVNQTIITEDFLTTINGLSFKNPKGYGLDLHWHLLRIFYWDKGDEEFWASAVPIRFQDLAVLALNPTDQLFHVCVHGVTHSMLMLRWIPDSMMVINNAGKDLDWERLYSHAVSQKLVLPVKDALAFLYDKLQAPIPGWLLEKLHAYTPSAFEVREYKTYAARIGIMGRLPKLWYQYQRNHQKQRLDGNEDDQMSFIKYIQISWGVENLLTMPLVTFRKGIQRVIKKTEGLRFN